MAAQLEALLFMGDRFEGRVTVGEQAFLLDLPRDGRWHEGQTIYLGLPAAAVTLWPRAARG